MNDTLNILQDLLERNHAAKLAERCTVTCRKCGHVEDITAGPAFDATRWTCPKCGAGKSKVTP